MTLTRGVSILGLLASMTPCIAIQESPWLGNLYEMEVEQSIAYQRYHLIDQALSQPLYPYNTYVTATALSFTPMAQCSGEIEVELARTPAQLYGFRSGALSIRYQVLDDVQGDMASVVFGGIIRAVPGRSVQDVSCPYPSYMNYEAFASVGKEFLKRADWILRGFVMGSFGLPGKGSAWDRVLASLEYAAGPSKLSLFALGYFGYGVKDNVDIDDFKGWSYINHSSLDLGVQYHYEVGIWGKLTLSYSYRIFAKSYPQGAQTLELFYQLPFSLF